MHLKLRAKRVERQMSQTDLASKLGMNLATYSRKERGVNDFTLTEIQDLLYYLDCEFDDIFFKRDIANICENEK